jgi:hypothetical protein
VYFFHGFGTLPPGAVATAAQRAAVARPVSEWLEPFDGCFTHVAQRGVFRRYLLGLLSDSRRNTSS